MARKEIAPFAKAFRHPESTHTPKIFVLDTNVILHDHDAIHHFQDNDLYVPVTVIEELDKFKKGNDALAFNARSFVRDIEKMSEYGTFAQGISLGPGKGTIRIEPAHPFSGDNSDVLFEDIPDHRIISTAIHVKETHTDRKVILVSKDINMRLKARALGMPSQDYLTDHVEDRRLERAQKEVTDLKSPGAQIMAEFLSGKGSVSPESLGIRKRPTANQLFRMGDVRKDAQVLARYDAGSGSVVRVRCRTAFGISPRNDEQTFAMEAILNPDIKLISLTGPSGTGKTTVALAGALEQSGTFSQILLSRPLINDRNRELIFLQGTPDISGSPFMLPLYDHLSVIKNSLGQDSTQAGLIDGMLKSGKLAVSPVSFIRGRSLRNTFLIVDDAQNLTPSEIRTIITRAGENTKMVFTGDIYRTDQPYLDANSNGLTHLGEKMQGQSIFEHIHLRKGEMSRLSELAGKLL